MTRAVAHIPSDLVLSSTTESQEAIDHAVSEEWKDPFIPKAQKEADEKTKIEAAKAVLEAEETPEQKIEREAKDTEGEHVEETPDERAQRIADEAEPVKGNWSKRVNKLTARNARIAEELRTEREARERLESRLAALERGERAIAPSSDAASAISDLPGKPKRIDFTDDGAYVEKLIQWTKANEDYKEQIQVQNEYTKRIFKEHNARIAQARERHDDWDETTESAKDMTLPTQVDFAIRGMSNSDEVLYFLAKHPEAYEKLSGMDIWQQVIEAGRISDRLLAANGNGNGKSRKARVSVPEPITPGGRRPTSQGKKLDDMDMDEYYRARMTQRAQRRAR